MKTRAEIRGYELALEQLREGSFDFTECSKTVCKEFNWLNITFVNKGIREAIREYNKTLNV